MEFKDLPKEIQENLIEKNRDINIFEDWWETEIDFWKKKLDRIGFENADIHFSGFWSQGDGACFDATINLKKIINKYWGDIASIFFPNMKLIKNEIDCIYPYIEKLDNRYYHENTRKVVLEWQGEDISEEENDKLDRLEEFIEGIRYKMCKQIYKSLEKEYEYLTSDEAVTDALESNPHYWEDELEKLTEREWG